MNPDVEFFQLASQKQQLKLESKGLMSSGGALRPRLAKMHGLKPRDSREKYIEVIQAKMDYLVETKQMREALLAAGYLILQGDEGMPGAWSILAPDDPDAYCIFGDDLPVLIRQAVNDLREVPA